MKKKPVGTYHHGNLREAIVVAASKIVREEGPLELTVRRVALQLGVTHAAVYHHFEDRTGILAGVAEAAFVALGEAIVTARAAAGPSALHRFAANGMAYAQFALQNPRLYGVMFGPEATERHAYPNLAAAWSRVFELTREAIVECQQEGVVLGGDPDEHALFCWSASHGFASLMVDRQLSALHLSSEDPNRLSELIVLRVFTGLGARPEFEGFSLAPTKG